MADEAKDFLAVITVNGMGSWARGPNKDQAIKDVVRRFKADFKSIFKLRGKTLNIDVLDVTGHGTVSWDDRCFWDKDGKSLDVPAEVVKHTF